MILQQQVLERGSKIGPDHPVAVQATSIVRSWIDRPVPGEDQPGGLPAIHIFEIVGHEVPLRRAPGEVLFGAEVSEVEGAVVETIPGVALVNLGEVSPVVGHHPTLTTCKVWQNKNVKSYVLSNFNTKVLLYKIEWNLFIA